MPQSEVEIRVTRPDRYPYAFRNDLTGQQGHYFRGKTEEEAAEKARKAFPGESLTFTKWKEWDENGNLVFHGVTKKTDG